MITWADGSSYNGSWEDDEMLGHGNTIPTSSHTAFSYSGHPIKFLRTLKVVPPAQVNFARPVSAMKAVSWLE